MAAALVLAFLIVSPASPAAAEASITVNAPRADAALRGASVTVSGTADSVAPLLNRVRRVTLTIKDKTHTVECPDGPCPFTWTTSLPLNGPYEVKVAATEVGRLLGNEGETSRLTRQFAVAAPAARPTVDPPKVNEARNVELSWSRNSEPDMLHYLVRRKDPGASEFSSPVKVPHPASGSRVTLTDTTTSGFSGGEYTYQVVAVRMGATGTDASQSESDPSAPRSATVPVPPTTSSTSAAPQPGSPAGGPTTTVKPGPPGGVDLSGFLTSRAQPVALPPITVPEPPDTGFEGSLPFGARPPGEELEEGEAEAVPPRGGFPGSSFVSIDAGRPLVPVAGGLVLLLLALHMRLLGNRVKAPADGDPALDLAPHTPEPPAAGPPPPPPPAPTIPAPDPHRTVYDLEADVDDDEGDDREESWEQDWAAPAPEPEPEPEPEPVELPVVAAAPAAPVAREPEEPEVVNLWAPPDPPDDPEQPAEVAEQTDTVDPDAIEVVEVVSPTRRRLVRTGGR